MLVELVAEAGLVTDVLENRPEGHVTQLELVNAERPNVTTACRGIITGVQHIITVTIVTTGAGGARLADDEVQPLAGSVWLGVDLTGTQAKEVESLFHGGVVKIDQRDDDVIELLLEILDTSGRGG